MNQTWQVNDSSPSPQWILDMYHDYFDPCPLDDNPKFDGLTIPWKKYNYVNCPYSNKKPWILKAIEEQKKGKTSVLILPVNSFINMLLEANAEMRPMGRVRWTHAITGEAMPCPSTNALFILKGFKSKENA